MDERLLASPEDLADNEGHEVEAIRAALPQDVGLHHVSVEAAFQPSPCTGNDLEMAQQQLQQKLQDLWMVSPNA